MISIEQKINKSIERLRAFEPEEGYYLCFSGGKDSQVIYHLAQMAGVKFDAHYNVTSVDPPELIHFIKSHYPDVVFDIPRYKDGTQITMWNLIERNRTPPTRIIRYCCSKLKESNGKGRVDVTGVRWAESSNRRRNQDEECAEHESKHREPIGISAATYVKDGGAEHGAPRVLWITFPEGRCARYVFREWERKEKTT